MVTSRKLTYLVGVAPRPSFNSDHQDDITFSGGGDTCKPSFTHCYEQRATHTTYITFLEKEKIIDSKSVLLIGDSDMLVPRKLFIDFKILELTQTIIQNA